MKNINLYTTLGCHLCEEAKALSWPLLQHLGYCLHEVEIADDVELLERYGVRIPVFKREDRELSLNWPFDTKALAAYLSE